DEWSGDLKLEYVINRDSKITGLHQTVEQDDVWRTHATIYGKSWEGTSIGNDREQLYDQKRRLTYIQYQGGEPLFFLDQLKVNLSYQVNEEERFRVRSNGKSEIQGFDVKTIGAWFQADKRTSLGKWTYGAEFYRDDVGSFQRNYRANGSLDKVEIQGPVADDATYDLSGIYCQDDVQALRSVDLILGARYSYFKADARKVRNPLDGSAMSISGRWDSFVGSLRALFRAGKESTHVFFGGVSQGFRAPNLSDLTRFDTARSNEIEIASPGLAPEKFITYEAGFKTEQDRLAAQVSYFYTSIEDMIIRVPTGTMIDDTYEVTKMNSGYGYVHGAEISVTLTILEQLRLSGSLGWLDGLIEGFPASTSQSAKEPISRLMPAMGQLAARWESDRKGYWLETCLSAADRQDELSASDRLDTQRIPPGGTPGYAAFDLRGGWRIGTHVEISAAIENIANEDYRIHGSGLNEPGRNVVIGVSCGF
ncbi:MAG: TonB-dependent receptor, partial [Candidatus Krumholzibacteria bacterium]|nr:TonB-dependent receptor [Candidatus Krumholzibacteria bacterium]